MITINCDKCEQDFQVEPHLAGHKVECPKCGDVNRVPEAAAEPKPEPKPQVAVASPSDAASKPDRAAAAGQPPDHGPELRVVKVRRCWFRSRPLKFAGVVALIVGGIVGMIWSNTNDHANFLVWAWLALPVGGAATLAYWWLDRLSAAIEITNKRTIQHRGFLSRSTSEVVHDNIRNIQIDQRFWQRVWGVGRLGISSSGQDGIEIQINHLRNPDKLREMIDLYRPL